MALEDVKDPSLAEPPVDEDDELDIDDDVEDDAGEDVEDEDAPAE